MRRTAGVTHLTLFTRPAPCGGKCLFCPTVPGQAKSYLPHADLRRFGLPWTAAAQLRFWLGRRTAGAGAKIEVIVLGGSFAALAREEQDEFLRGIYLGATGLEEGDDPRPLAEVIAAHADGDGPRVIGITVEMRPDQVTQPLLARLFAAGVTKIELGVQSLDDRVLALNERGHDAAATAAATSLIRGFGLKAGYHLMLGLPGASSDSDLATVEAVFTESRHRPDHLKLYFCEMFRREFMPERLVRMFDAGEWRPLVDTTRRELLRRILPRVPQFIRISRIGRKAADDEFEQRGRRLDRGVLEKEFGCRCVRCREPRPEEIVAAAEARITWEKITPASWHGEIRPAGRDTCLGLVRLTGAGETAFVRELHVYGLETKPGEVGPQQHRGLGGRLLAAAEARARAQGCVTLAVASGVGVRRYYEKRGYRLADSGMMEKKLT